MGLFMQHAHKQNLVCAENCLQYFQREFLRPAGNVRSKVMNVRTYG